ncbi:MAG: hypothetical protein QOI91_1047 [Solirubrobacteraceae bacterium]|jgi:hypothetical protein|nr:hypothetical protein [Solirubrobacteraceae bacterium]
MSRIALVTFLLAAAYLAVPAVAHGGSYTVYACGSDGVNRAFWPSANTGLTASASCPGVDYLGQTTGLATRADRNAGGGRLGPVSSAWHIFDAPPGAVIQSMTLRLSSGRSHGCWSIGVWGWNGDAFHPGNQVWGFPGNCSITGSGFTWFAGPYTIDLHGYQHARIGVRCDSTGGCRTDETATWTSAKDVAVTVRDDSEPGILLRSGQLLSDGWHRGTETAWADFGDNVGIRHIYGLVDGGNTFSFHDFAASGWPESLRCDYARPRPCADIQMGGVHLDTNTVPDGAHALRVVAVDAAGNTAYRERAIRVDNHAPVAPSATATVGGEDWRPANHFDVTWQNPTGQVAPIARAHWRLCRAGSSSECRTGARDGRDVAATGDLRVPEAGDWTLAVWLADEAGNVDAEHTADPVHLRLDDVAPETPGFDLPDPADPRRVSLPTIDRHSGLATARIELRERGRAEWRALPTGLEPDGRAAAQIPDTVLPDGAYELRAVLRDRAGNEAVATTDRAGRAMTVVLPVRAGTRFVLRHSAARPLRPAFGRPATLAGVLETSHGRPVAGASVTLIEQLRDRAGWRAVGAATTDAAGALRLRVAPGPSRTLRLAYGGADVLLPATGEARVLVAAAGTLRVSRRRVRNGAGVLFSGRLRGRPFPPGGRTVDLQAHYRGAWRTFATPRTGQGGRWRYRYRFGATTGRVLYRFRAVVKREAAYPYEDGATRVVSVTVTG